MTNPILDFNAGKINAGQLTDFLSVMDCDLEISGNITHFNAESVPQLSESSRYGFETLAAQTKTPNDQGFIFTAEAMPGVVAAYKLGRPLMVNHTKYGLNLGFGQTLDAVFNEENLIVLSYISRGKTTPNGPFGNTDELIEGINDGFVKYASASGYVRKQRCSICKKDGPQSPLRGCLILANLILKMTDADI